jgi:hypothetical protein
MLLGATLAPPVHAASATPRIAMALPQTSTGALTGTFTWLPPPTEPDPVVVPAAATPVPDSANIALNIAIFFAPFVHRDLFIPAPD